MKSRDEPNMSDTTILTSVEDLINMAMGPPDKNVVNFKMIQAVLHILARQLRMLETHVEVRIRERSPPRQRKSRESITDSSSSKSPPSTSPVKHQLRRIKEETGGKAADKQRVERTAAKETERAVRNRDKADRTTSKEREKADRVEHKEQEKADRAASREREKADKSATKDKEKAEREAIKGQERMEKASVKEKDREDKALAKERAKADKELDKSARVQEKAEKYSIKEKEKEERAMTKEQAKAERTAVKEREKEEKERGKTEKEQDKAERAAAKEMAKADKNKEKMARELEKADKEIDRAERVAEKEKKKAESPSPKLHRRDKDKRGSATSITVSEVDRQKEKVLVVEKGPTTRIDSRTRVGSIEVVTLSQFAMLEAAVKELRVMAAPLPSPAMPENQQLRADIASGGASLTDVMQAMQVTARVQAAEMAIERMAGLITELAASGAIPDEYADMVEDMRKDGAAIGAPVVGTKSRAANLPRKSVAIDPISSRPTRMEEGGQPVTGQPSVASTVGGQSVAGQPSLVSGPGGPRPSVASARRPSVISRQSAMGMAGVTHSEMNDALRGLKEGLTKNMNNMTSKASTVAETAAVTAKAVAEKLDIALKLNTRISTLYSLVSDYAEQLSGFDSGLTTQMLSFQEQMSQMRSDLKGGLTQLEQANNNAETAAVTELTERYDGLVKELDHTLHTHQGLTTLQHQLADELRSLVECVEMLREQKADRDEVLDGLRDKADLTRLAGLLSETEFAQARLELERRLHLCYEKFKKQEQVWISALKELSQVTESKAEVMQLLAARDHAQQDLRHLQRQLHRLADALGEPEALQAALLTRQLARYARCGACLVPALMPPADAHYGAPPPLPALPPPPRPRPAGADVPAAPAVPDLPCLTDWQPPDMGAHAHACHRWVGGSHTLVAGGGGRAPAPPPAPLPAPPAPVARYAGYGTDGRLYMMEEELQPCVECNILYTYKNPDDEQLGAVEELPVETGAGDQGGRRPTTVAE